MEFNFECACFNLWLVCPVPTKQTQSATVWDLHYYFFLLVDAQKRHRLNFDSRFVENPVKLIQKLRILNYERSSLTRNKILIQQKMRRDERSRIQLIFLKNRTNTFFNLVDCIDISRNDNFVQKQSFNSIKIGQFSMLFSFSNNKLNMKWWCRH